MVRVAQWQLRVTAIRISMRLRDAITPHMSASDLLQVVAYVYSPTEVDPDEAVWERL